MDNELNYKAVILITIDALRADHLKSYNYNRNTAPNLEKFISKGLTFLKAISNGPETPSSFSAIFTSTLPFLYGGYSPLPLEKITFPQILKENGIFTYAIHSNPHLGGYFNYNQGFDVFLDGERYKIEQKKREKLTIKEIFFLNIRKLLNYHNLAKKVIYRLRGFNKIKDWFRKKYPIITDIFLPFAAIAYNAPYVTNKLISFLNNIRGNVFLWAHFMDVHSPFNPPSKNVLNFRSDDISFSEREFLNEQVRQKPKEFKITPDRVSNLEDLYDGGINFLDESLAKFFKIIESKFKKNCLILITADHGESFYEHGYFHHQGNIFDELLKVPFFMVELGNSPSVKTVKETIQLMSIPPTILDYFGIEIPKRFQGKSLIPYFNGKSLNQDNIVISECYQKAGKIKRNNKEGFKLISLRNDKWKYIFDEEKNIEHFYNLSLDPEEKNNLIKKNPSKLNEFIEIKNKHLQNVLESHEKSEILKGIKKINLSRL